MFMQTACLLGWTHLSLQFVVLEIGLDGKSVNKERQEQADDGRDRY